MDARDISTSHRLGRPNDTYNRAVICKFSRRDVKRLVMRKKNLKEKDEYKDVYVNEDLTRVRYKICKELRTQDISSWTREGKIFAKLAENNVITIDTYKDFTGKLNWSEDKLKELDILQ